MLLAVTVESNSKRPNEIGARLIRAEAAFEAVVSGTGCQFKYPLNDRDRRESLSVLKITENQAALIAGMDAGYGQVSITLPIHPNKDATAATVSTVFTGGDVVWGAPYAPDAANKSWLWIQQGAFKVTKYLVDNTLAEIILLA